jgi:undecaprenyl diphosphate synthase
VCWPDFDREELLRALYEYDSRTRRFGKTDEQLEEGE